MFKYEIGEPVPEFIDQPESVRFDIADDGASVIVFFETPTEHEISQFKSGIPLEMRYTVLNDIVMLTFKFGDLAWMDAPYTPGLSKNLSKLDLPGKKEGLAVTIYLVDTRTGILKNIRLISLRRKFTEKLISDVSRIWRKPFDAMEFQKNLNSIYLRYNTKDIMKMSNNNRFKI